MQKELKILFSLMVGAMIGAISFTSVIIPSNLMGGGIGGFAQLLNKTTGLNMQLILASMFLPIAVWAFYKYGIKQIITASICFIFFTMFMGITPLIVPTLKTDPILAAIVAGVLLGISGGVVLRLGVSNGPEALIGMYLKEKFNLSMGIFMIIFNSIIILLSLFSADVTVALYSTISIYISGKITDFMILGFGRYYEMNIITKEYITIAGFIQTEIKRGVTYIQCIGAYELRNNMMVKTLVKSDEIIKIKNYIKTVDLECFIYINESSEVIGTSLTMPVAETEPKDRRNIKESDKVIARGLQSLYNPIEGEIVNLKNVPDKTFSGKCLGDGFAIIPTGNKVYSPADGRIVVLFPTKHAVALLTEEGIEILIHIGIDTVNLDGEGFIAHIEKGAKVKKGDLLITFDTEIVKQKASLISPVVITNMDVVNKISIDFGNKKVLEKVAEVTLL